MTGAAVFRAHIRALERCATEISHTHFADAVDLLSVANKVVTTGTGKSGIAARKIAATFTSTRTPAVFMHPTEALHGGLGILQKRDVLLVVSASGNGYTEAVDALWPLHYVERNTVAVIALTDPSSGLGVGCDIVLDCTAEDPHPDVPTASTIVAITMGDALALAVMERKGITHEDLERVHPAGALFRLT